MIKISEYNVPAIRKLIDKGGVEEWDSADLCRPSACWFAPAGSGKPHYAAGKVIATAATAADVVVIRSKEVARFRVAIRLGGSGTRIKLTDASRRRVEKATSDREGRPKRWHTFDYATQEAVIWEAGGEVSLVDYKET
jgi:hypothetical protein